MNSALYVDAVDEFTLAMREYGIQADAPVIGDGRLHRFRVTGDKSNSKNGWYVLHLDGLPAGAFGCYKRDVSATWCARSEQTLTANEKQELAARVERSKAEQAAELERVRAACKVKAARLWGEARETVAADHGYLVAKGVEPYGLRQLKELLLVPLHNVVGEMIGLQLIQPDGSKRFLTGTSKAGNYFRIDGNNDRLLICEGFATGASLHEATGYAVVVAFDAGNLLPVAKAIRAALPDATLVLCADDDVKGDTNTGLNAAQAAAEAAGGCLAVPDFGADRPGGASDFNDLHQHKGLAAVAACVAAAHAAAVTEIGSSPASESPTAPETEDQLIARLAGLTDLAYYRVQAGYAESLGIRPAQLDKLVAKARRSAMEARADDSGSPVLFADVDPWDDEVNGAALLTELSAAVRRFVVCEPTTADAAALWALFTWLIDSVSIAPIAMITAPEMRCGKTVMLSFLGRVSCRPLAASNITGAAIFRCVEAWKPTLLIDEADAFMRDNEDVRGILNSGHTRESAFVVRTVGEDFEPRRFSTWGAKAIAGIGKLSATLADRSIPLELRRKLPGESAEKLRHADPALFDELSRKMARWAEDNAPAVRSARPLPVAINDRAQDNWEPLLTIADIAGGDWPDRARKAAIVLSGGEQEAPSTNAELLADIQAVFDRKRVIKLFSVDLLEALCADPESPWATWNHGKPMSARQLSVRLAAFGIKPDDVRDGAVVRKGYTLKKFTDAFARYLTNTAKPSATTLQASSGAGSSHFSSATPEQRVADEKPLKAMNGAACSVVAGGSHLLGQKAAKGWEVTL